MEQRVRGILLQDAQARVNENMVSVAVIGYDRQTEEVVPGKSVGQADAIMVLAVNLDTGKTTGIGIPRDSMVEVGEFMGDTFTGMSTMQLCLAYAYGDGGELSSQYTASAVSRVLYNMPVNYYFSLDMDGVGALADAIGGVSLTPTQSIPNTNIVEGEPTVFVREQRAQVRAMARHIGADVVARPPDAPVAVRRSLLQAGALECPG